MQSAPVTILRSKQDYVFKNVLANPEIREICLYGGSRSGKTFLACDYVHNRAVAYPRSFHLFVRSTLTALTGGVIKQTFPDVFNAYKNQGCPDFMNTKTDVGKLFVEFKANPYSRYEYYNGSEIRFMGLDVVSSDPRALDKILSQEFMTIVIEEGPEMDWEAVEMLKSRLAQKVKHYITGRPGIPKIIVTLNPRLFEDWDYVYFQKKIHPVDESPLKHPERITSVHFELSDNKESVADEYLETLESLSASKQARFLHGQYSDSFDGEIFKKLHWDTLPDIREFESIILYTDPSYKSGPKNDFKATVAVGKRQGAFWLIDCKAMQTTTSQMVMNVHDVYAGIVNRGYTKPIYVWFENAGMPDDFTDAIHTHAVNHGWVCPYQLDARDKGDKFARIETILEPLNNQGKFFINNELRSTRQGNLITVQFLTFKKKLLPTEHDDIPDACHGAVTLINTPVLKAGNTTIHKRPTTNIG